MAKRLREHPEVPPSIHNTVWQAASGTRGRGGVVESDSAEESVSGGARWWESSETL